MHYKWLFTILLSVILFLPKASHAQSVTNSYVPGEVIIKYKTDSIPTHGRVLSMRAKSRAQVLSQQMMSEKRLSIKRAFAKRGIFNYKIDSSEKVSDLINELKNDPRVEYAEPNYYVATSDTYTQTSAPVSIPQAWSSLPAGGTPPVVGIIDTGMDHTHPALAAAVWTNPGEIPNNGIDDDGNGFVDDVYGWNFADNNNNPSDCNNHGTHVSGIVRGTSQDITPDGFGTLPASINQAKMKLMAVKFLDCDGVGTTSAAVSAIYYAVDNGAKVLNNSWGGGSYSTALADAIDYAYQHGVLFVAAAGNSGVNIDASPSYPAAYPIPNVIAVGATDSFDNIAYFSNYGINTVPIAAPGVSIYSTIPNNQFETMSGTSMAAPFVTGLAAMILYEKPTMNGYQVKNIITEAGDKILALATKIGTGGARIDALTTVVNAASATVSTTQPAYDISALNASRAPASTSGVGCGLVQKVYDKYDNDQRDTSGRGEPISIFITILLFAIPLVTALSLRKKSKNQRRYDRYFLGSQVQIKMGEKDYLGSVGTISLGGLSFNSEIALALGHNLHMAVASPDGTEQIIVDGEIVWTANNNNYGVKFVNVAEKTILKINQWSKNLKAS